MKRISASGRARSSSDRARWAPTPIRPKCQIVHRSARSFGVVTESSEAYELSNVVETALAKALVWAAAAKRWDVVLQIVSELQARRSGTRVIERKVGAPR